MIIPFLTPNKPLQEQFVSHFARTHSPPVPIAQALRSRTNLSILRMRRPG